MLVINSDCMKKFTLYGKKPGKRYYSNFFSPMPCLLLGLCMIGFLNTNAQINRQKPVADSIVEQKLVELAKQAPSVDAAMHQNKIDEYQLKAAKNSWLNLLSISGNYNDQSFAKTTSTTGYVYPKYFFGVNIPLGTLLSRTSVKAAKEQIEISKDREIELSRHIQADVLSKYKRYKYLNQLIANQ